MGVIGDTLSEARTRRGVDLDEVQAATGIRLRYLRAIEQEDWDGLPEEFYARSFIRKYAQFLDVDPEPLVEDYRRQRGTGGAGRRADLALRADHLATRRGAAPAAPAPGGLRLVGGAAVLVAIVAAIVLLASGGGTAPEKAGAGRKRAAGAEGEDEGPQAEQAPPKPAGQGNGAVEVAPRPVTLTIEPTGEVWTCVLDAKGKPLVDGVTLAAGKPGALPRASYTAAFGNGSVTVWVDGKRGEDSLDPQPDGLHRRPPRQAPRTPGRQAPELRIGRVFRFDAQSGATVSDSGTVGRPSPNPFAVDPPTSSRSGCS